MECVGTNGTVCLDEHQIRISHRGFANLLTAGAHGEKSIPVANITAVQFKEAGWTAGYIQFTLRGGFDRGGGILEATRDENAVLFDKDQQPAFRRLRKEVEERIKAREPSSPAKASSAGVSVTDELERLASLVDRGFLTREEFDARKATLLR